MSHSSVFKLWLKVVEKLGLLCDDEFRIEGALMLKAFAEYAEAILDRCANVELLHTP